MPFYVLPYQDAVEINVNEKEETVVITQRYNTGDPDSTIFVHNANLQRFIDALTDLAKQLEV
jgi:hypothetical protein